MFLLAVDPKVSVCLPKDTEQDTPTDVCIGKAVSLGPSKDPKAVLCLGFYLTQS